MAFPDPFCRSKVSEAALSVPSGFAEILRQRARLLNESKNREASPMVRDTDLLHRIENGLRVLLKRRFSSGAGLRKAVGSNHQPVTGLAPLSEHHPCKVLSASMMRLFPLASFRSSKAASKRRAVEFQGPPSDFSSFENYQTNRAELADRARAVMASRAELRNWLMPVDRLASKKAPEIFFRGRKTMPQGGLRFGQAPIPSWTKIPPIRARRSGFLGFSENHRTPISGNLGAPPAA